MLNLELREYFARLPGHYKVRSQGLEFYGKWLLRESMKKRMPKRLLSRPKRTMMAPLDRWLKNDGRSFLAQQITEMTRKEHHIFQPNRLQTLYREHTTGQRNHGLKLWTLILFHLWFLISLFFQVLQTSKNIPMRIHIPIVIYHIDVLMFYELLIVHPILNNLQ